MPSRRSTLLAVGSVLEGSLLEAVEAAGLSMESVPDVEAALAALDDVECVVAPWTLPDGTGADLAERVAGVDEQLPVVLLTDRAPSSVGPRAAAAGAVACLPRSETTDENAVAAIVHAVERYERAAEQAHESRMLTNLLRQIPLSIYFKDRQGRGERSSFASTVEEPDVFIENPEGKVHPHPADTYGKTDWDLFEPEYAEETTADDRRVMETGEPIVNKLEEGRTATGTVQHVSTTKAPRYDEDGEVVGLVGVTVDVTEREQHKRELERQNARLEEFAEVLTHDLRSPINVASGYLDALREDPSVEYIEECETALERIEQLIAEIRAFVMLGRTIEDPVVTDLAQVARRAWRSVETPGASLVVETDLRLEADPDRLQRALENVFRNALDHGGSPRTSAEGSDADGGGAGTDDADYGGGAEAGSLTVTVGDVPGSRGFYVADDGPGLTDEDRHRVFDRGFTTTESGTGFGLAIVADIAEAHGWEVAAVDGEDGGARIEFTDVVVVAEDVERATT